MLLLIVDVALPGDVIETGVCDKGSYNSICGSM